MKFLADFHIHSKYSYATSKTMDLQALATWGQLKGLTVMGTGDFTHPVWRKELQQQLVPVEQGLFSVQPKLHAAVEAGVYEACRAQQRFLLTAEIATVFRRSGKCYKTHSIIFAPSLEIAEKVSDKLATIGNIAYDGRPMLSLDVKDLLQLVLDISPECMLIPAHIWTPHFGLLGSKSGFNSVEECFGNLTNHIYALEKGLSSSYAMNAQLSSLDRFALLCNSDAHSVQNLGREANIFNVDLSYNGIVNAFKKNDPTQLVAGVEFFPEMGKYYGSGHRNCGIYRTVREVTENKICPVCCTELTIGVAYRVNQLADRSVEQAQQYLRQRYRIAPLQEIIAINFGLQVSSKKVQKLYQHLLSVLGNEFSILLDADLVKIAQHSNFEIVQSISAMRQGNVILSSGYDGVYGTIRFDV